MRKEALIVELPESVKRYTVGDVSNHLVRWNPDPWRDVFRGFDEAFLSLSEHVISNGGITRSYVHDRAAGDPVELFLLAMAWGYGTIGYGPTRVRKILSQTDSRAKLADIVVATRAGGAEAGWIALLRQHRIKGLGMAFGTKLLYFAGYSCQSRPRPLILDQFVRRALHQLIDPVMPVKTIVRLDDYLRYLEVAEYAASQLGEPDVLEYALFELGKGLSRA
ncbi:hypothetical protein [Gordonia polyisoprenivorans]|uniref:8-oxoguanine DNA glycosylase OGG fold protein n=1 Tax=Gordonia polyisoprenivorans TaxID=84595 RepID=UPI000B99DDDB|nr:hypothetical protein [Gordonia polyisoprenivorans]OZC33159.1 hypothetical protein CJJ17_18005 [Gordonia polyisoprenivorans]